MTRKIKKNLEKIEKQRLEYVYENRKSKANYSIRAIHTLRNLEQLPISAISPKNIEFISNY